MLTKGVYIHWFNSRAVRPRVEHAGSICRAGVTLAHPPHSAVLEHAKGCDVSVVKCNFRILNCTTLLVDLSVLESLDIFKNGPGLNSTQSRFLSKLPTLNVLFLLVYSWFF